MCAASAALLVVLGSRLSFFNDDWWFLLQRPGLESHRGLDTLLAPHNGSMALLLAVLYKALVAVFGLGSQVPFRVPIAIGIVCLGVLVYIIVAARLGSAVGLAAAAVILFLGPAWEALLFFGGSNHLGAVVLGLAALVVLERDTGSRNALACALLLLAVSFSNTGVAFLAGAVVVVLLRRRPAELWVPAVPALLYGLWWALYGHTQSTGVTLGHIEHLPRYLFDSASIGLAAITGLEHVSLPGAVSSGHVLTVLAGLLLIVWLARGGRPSAWAAAVACTLLTFWLLTGASAIPGRGAISSRYQLTDSVLLIVLAAELLRGTRFDNRPLYGLAAIAVAIVVSNLLVLRHGYDFLRVEAAYTRADLGALELARPLAPPGLSLLAPVAQDPYLSGVTAGRYYSVTRAHGAPPFYTAAQILAAPPAQRHAADSVLAAAYRISSPPVERMGSLAGCSRLAADGTEQTVKPPGVVIRNLGAAPLVVGVARFAPQGMPVYIGFLAGRATARVEIPTDRVAVPWRITLRNPRKASGAATRICQAIS
jgi:hypothetical protein